MTPPDATNRASSHVSFSLILYEGCRQIQWTRDAHDIEVAETRRRWHLTCSVPYVDLRLASVSGQVCQRLREERRLESR